MPKHNKRHTSQTQQIPKTPQHQHETSLTTIETKKNIHLTHFHNYYVELLQLLKSNNIVDRDIINCIYDNYKEKSRIDYIKLFVESITDYKKYINTHDEELFSKENDKYLNKPIYLIPTLDFKLFWTKLNDDQKVFVWDHLLNLMLIGNFVLSENNMLSKKLEKQQEIMKKMLKDLLMSEKLENASKKHLNDDGISTGDTSAPTNVGDMADKLKDLMCQNKIINTIVTEILNELGLKDITNSNINLTEDLKKLFGSDGSKLTEIATKIKSKIEKYIVSNPDSITNIINDLPKLNDILMSKLNAIPQLSIIKKFAEQLCRLDIDGCENLDINKLINDNLKELGISSFEELLNGKQ